jgi:hypothetical protein
MTTDGYYELRMYQCAPGRIGYLHHHMCYRVPPIFKKNGVVPPLVNWESFAGSMTPLYAYMLHWPDLDTRMTAFRRFYADAASNARRLEGDPPPPPSLDRIELMILRPSPAWAPFRAKADSSPVAGLHELRIHKISTRDSEAAHKNWGDIDLPFLAAKGAKVLGVFSSWFATGTPHIVSILAWDNLEARTKAYAAHEKDPVILETRAAERKKYEGALFEHCDIHLMRPAWYGIPRADLRLAEVK